MDDRPIVIAYDGSDAARGAVREAGQLFAQRQVLIVTVWEPALEFEVDALSEGQMHPPVVDPEAVEELEKRLVARAHRIAESGAELARSVGLQAHPLAAHDEGHVWAAIVEVAQARGAAAIVVG
jgi:nucleotide-binding universal stress UspA family protein